MMKFNKTRSEIEEAILQDNVSVSDNREDGFGEVRYTMGDGLTAVYNYYNGEVDDWCHIWDGDNYITSFEGDRQVNMR